MFAAFHNQSPLITMIKRTLFFEQVALFSLTITHVMFFSLSLICPRYYDKNGKIMWRLSSKLNGSLTQIENSKWRCHFQPITVYVKSVRK